MLTAASPLLASTEVTLNGPVATISSRQGLSHEGPSRGGPPPADSTAINTDAWLLPGVAALELDEPLEHLNEHGWARLGRCLSSAATQAVAARADDLMAGRVTHDGLFFQHDSPTGLYRDLKYREGWIGPSPAYRKIERLERDAVFWALVCSRLFGRLANTVLGQGAMVYRTVLWTKAAGAGMHLPWHQDDGNFWGLDTAPSLQVWVALDDAPVQSGCIEVMPRTHLDGLASPEGGTVRDGVLNERLTRTEPLLLPAKAGEVLLLHNHLWHRSGCNSTALPRRAVSVSYLHRDTRCLRRKRAPRQFLTVPFE